MSEHKVVVTWDLQNGNFRNGSYSRAHKWRFDGGAEIAASPSPMNVPPPFSDPAAVDPEEAFVASIASCHMLTFLYLAYRAGFNIVSYEDEAVGYVGKNENGAPWIKTVLLQPAIEYVGDKVPSSHEEEKLHHAAHQQCFIANSVKTEIAIAARRHSPEGLSSSHSTL
jgi:organic hydroperoxide reductase OsmC/OhrA